MGPVNETGGMDTLKRMLTKCREPLGKASKQNKDDTKTGVHSRSREQYGGYLLTGHAVSGAEGA
jgi:hypothetical protein